jgi:hypothetical protein
VQVRIPVDLLNQDRKEGIFLNMDKLIAMEPVGRNIMVSFSIFYMSHA